MHELNHVQRIKLIERETAEQINRTRDCNAFSYCNPINTNPNPDVLLQREKQKNAFDPEVLLQRAEQNFKEIADNTNMKYILDRLEDDDLFFLVNS